MQLPAEKWGLMNGAGNPLDEGIRHWREYLAQPEVHAEREALEKLVFHCGDTLQRLGRDNHAIALARDVLTVGLNAVMCGAPVRAEEATLAADCRASIASTAKHLADLQQKQSKRATIARIIARLDKAKANIEDGHDPADVAAGIESDATDPVPASLVQWQKAIATWHGYLPPRRGEHGKRPNVARLPKGYRWDVVVYRLLNPREPEYRVKSCARNMQREYDDPSIERRQK